MVHGVSSAPSEGCSAPGQAQQALPEQHLLTVDTAAGPRGAVLRIPAELRVPTGSTDPAPLLVSLHPFTQGAEQWEQYSGLAEAALARGYAVLSPTGGECRTGALRRGATEWHPAPRRGRPNLHGLRERHPVDRNPLSTTHRSHTHLERTDR